MKSQSSKRRIHAHTRQKNQKRRPRAGGHTAPVHSSESSEQVLQEQIRRQEKYLAQLSKLQGQNAVFEQRALIVAKDLESQIRDFIIGLENVHDGLHNLGRPVARTNTPDRVRYIV